MEFSAKEYFDNRESRIEVALGPSCCPCWCLPAVVLNPPPSPLLLWVLACVVVPVGGVEWDLPAAIADTLRWEEWE